MMLSKQTRAMCRQLEGIGWNVMYDVAKGLWYLAPDGPDGWPIEANGCGRTRYFKTIPDAVRYGLDAMAATGLEEQGA